MMTKFLTLFIICMAFVPFSAFAETTLIIDGKVYQGTVTITTNVVTSTPTPPPVTPPEPPPVVTPVQGTGSYSDPVILKNYLSGVSGYGFHAYYGQQYGIPKSKSVYFKMDPSLISGISVTNFKGFIFNYEAYATNLTAEVIKINRTTGAESVIRTYASGNALQVGFVVKPWKQEEYYLIKVSEIGVKDSPVSVWWSAF